MHPRIFRPGPLTQGTQVRVEDPAANHLLKALRLKEGDEFILFNGEGLDYQARIISAGRHDLVVLIGAEHEPNTESPAKIVLLQGICKNQRMDLLIQKSTELGVRSIRPLNCERSVVRIGEDRVEKRLQHWHGVAAGASAQCGRAVVPEIMRPQGPTEAIGQLDEKHARIVLDPAGSESLQDAIGESGSIALLVGPEGGLTPAEYRLARESGFKDVRIGPRVLRTETAPIAALSIIQYLCGDLARR